MGNYVVLFRAINVGGKRKVAMSDLTSLLENVGCSKVTIYIQSGNVILTSTKKTDALRNDIEKAFEKTFAFHSDVVIRSGEELKDIVITNPFLDRPGNQVVVSFLVAPPVENAEYDLRKGYKGDEQYKIINNNMYIYYPHGLGRSKFSGAYLDKKLGTMGTMRNIFTVTKLLDMIQSIH